MPGGMTQGKTMGINPNLGMLQPSSLGIQQGGYLGAQQLQKQQQQPMAQFNKQPMPQSNQQGSNLGTQVGDPDLQKNGYPSLIQTKTTQKEYLNQV